MLVINPDECIDCGVCEPECPEDAIRADSESIVHWTNINKEYSEKWYNNQIVDQKDPMPGHEEASKIADKTDLFDGNDYTAD
jgi:ferredoxin